MPNQGRGQGMGGGRGQRGGGQGRGQGGGRLGGGGFCLCPKCGEKTPHQAGSPCLEQRCPKCGSAMVREGSPHHQQIEDRKAAKAGS